MRSSLVVSSRIKAVTRLLLLKGIIMERNYFQVIYRGRCYHIRNKFRNLTRNQLEYAINLVSDGHFATLSEALEYVSAE